MSSPLRRINHDLRDLKNSDCNLIKGTTILEGTELPTVNIDIMGPDNSLYAGESFKIQVKFPRNYPFVAPIVTFVGPNIPVHPHIYSNGHICVSTLGDDWSPANTLITLCLSLISVLGSAEKKHRPPGDRFYVATASQNPKESRFFYHDDKA